MMNSEVNLLHKLSHIWNMAPQMGIVGALAAAGFLALIWSWARTKTRSPIRDWPVLGMLPGLLFNVVRIHDYFTEKLMQEKSHTIRVTGPKWSNLSFILTSDPENIHYILSTNFANFTKGEDFKDIFEVLGDGILAADSESWKLQRKLIHSVFKQGQFLRLAEAAARQKVQKSLFEILDHAAESGIEVDMQDLCQRFTLDVTCIFLLGFDLNSLALGLPEVPFAGALDDVEEVLLHRHLKPRSWWRFQQWLQVGIEKKATRAAEIFDEFIYHQISLKRKSCEDGFDLISIFMAEEHPNPTDKFLRDAVMNLLSAGRDTSSTALTWFFYLVSTNPPVEAKLLEELETSFHMKPGEPWRFPGFADLNKLVYLHATLCETLRLYPPVPFNHKASIRPDILPTGHDVGEGTKILFSIYSMGRMEQLWGSDAAVFKPERWISETQNIVQVPAYKFNVFGAGPRSCVGKELGFMEMKIAAAAIVWRYHLRIVEKAGQPVEPAISVILHMKHSLMAKVAMRNS